MSHLLNRFIFQCNLVLFANSTSIKMFNTVQGILDLAFICYVFVYYNSILLVHKEPIKLLLLLLYNMLLNYKATNIELLYVVSTKENNTNVSMHLHQRAIVALGISHV
jgi:hypothetical protein